MKKNKRCIDCGKLIWNQKKSKRCHSCAQIEVAKTFDPNYKHGKCLIQSYCIECGKRLAKLAFLHNTIFCVKCANKRKIIKIIGIGNPNYIDGRSITKNYCIDCKKEISWKSERCPECANIGKLNPNYKGGITSLERAIRLINKYTNWRKQVFERDNHTCQDCNQIDGKLQAHHIKTFKELFVEFLQTYNQFSPIDDKETLVRLAINWKPFWEIDNGKTLCLKCHYKFKIQTKGGIIL